MIAALIRWAIRKRFLVLLATVFLLAWGLWAVNLTPIDALPDLSDVQVVIRTTYPGQAPAIVENQVTYPLTTTMLSVPGARTVRGYSFFGDSFVYVLFDEGTDLYWARSRVLEYLNQVQSRLPASAKAAIGPDATGVGWVYEYALLDRTGQHDLAQLRSVQDWFLKSELKSLPNVAEVATIGGMVKQAQIVPDPVSMSAYRITLTNIIEAIQKANQETGGAVLEMAETEYMVRASGYLKTLDDFRQIPLNTRQTGVPVTLGQVAHIQWGPEMRRGLAELDGQGEVVGGVVILRSGKNARETIAGVKRRLEQLRHSLPVGVEIVTTYDRSQLIDRAIGNLSEKLVEEFIVVALVCGIFLWHIRSALVAIVALPLGVVSAFIVMHYQGVNANIMSLGGIAIAIGAMVDAAVVMIENAHKHLEAWQHQHPAQECRGAQHWQVITDAAVEVGPALFFSLLIITLSFIPVFTLEAQEGRLFGPLAFTKTYAMAAAAGLSVTLIPVLMGYWIRGTIPSEQNNPLSRFLIRLYLPLLNGVLRHSGIALSLTLLALISTLWPLVHLGGEFMPAMDEGDVLYMPSALPGISAEKAAELLQQTDGLIKAIPEVASVFGKAGRAETALDSAPMEMFETTIAFKPQQQWRPGMTKARLMQELDQAVNIPGLSAVWVAPIRNRVDMQATGIKSPIGVKVSGSDLARIDAVTQQIEGLAKQVPGVSSALAERMTGGRYLDIQLDRNRAARYGLNVADVQRVVASAIGGENIGELVDGQARYPISVRYPRELRDSPQALRDLPMYTDMGQQITLGTIATISISDGPAMLKSENSRLSGWVYIDVQNRDLSSVVADLRSVVASGVNLPAGMSVTYSGQFEYLERASARLKLVIPATLAIIFVLLYLIFGVWGEALLIMLTLPFALIGGVWFLYMLDYHFSVASGVGFIALAGVSAEFGVVMLIYLKQSLEARISQVQSMQAKTDLPKTAQPQPEQSWQAGQSVSATATRQVVLSMDDIEHAICTGAVQRVRPKAMTVAVILAGLMPILWGSGAGSEVMSRIAAPMVGGMITAPLLSMLIIPAVYRLMQRRRYLGR